MFQSAPSALSLSDIVSSNFLSGTSYCVSFCGININSFLLLLTSLVNLKPPALHMSLTFLTSVIASGTLATDFSMSST